MTKRREFKVVFSEIKEEQIKITDVKTGLSMYFYDDENPWDLNNMDVKSMVEDFTHTFVNILNDYEKFDLTKLINPNQ